MHYIDSHIHLEQYSTLDCEQMIVKAKEAGIDHVVAVSMNLQSAYATHRLSQQYGSFVIPAYGFHPEQPMLSKEDENELFNWIRLQAKQGECFAIGEVGLPYYTEADYKRDGLHFNKQSYIALLERFIVLAKQLDAPIVLHAVYEDAEIACKLLQKYNVTKAHFHWFKGDLATIKDMMESGYYISITPDVLYEEEIIELVKNYPLTQMMVETDGPWPFEGGFSGQNTEPSMVVKVVEAIANILSKQVEEVAQQIYQNSLSFYRLK